MLKLEELGQRARTRIANVLTDHVNRCRSLTFIRLIEGDMAVISRDVHLHFFVRPLDQWSNERDSVAHQFQHVIMTQPFNFVFDLIQFIMRHSKCHPFLIDDMKKAFADSGLAYAIDDSGPPTIVPIATDAEGKSILSSLQELNDAGLEGSASHLRKSAECIHQRKWADSIRESIHAVESVTVKIAPNANGLNIALRSLERRIAFHPALKKAILSLYGYTSDEKGIRHALLDEDEARVDGDDAVFMLGACASFASYLWRKHLAKST